MLINWRDIFSIISSPDPLFLSFCFSQPVAEWQQAGVSFLFSPDAEEVKVKARPASITAAVIIAIRVFRFMVMVLGFDECFSEFVTANLQILFPPFKSRFMNSGIFLSGCGNQGMKCRIRAPVTCTH